MPVMWHGSAAVSPVTLVTVTSSTLASGASVGDRRRDRLYASVVGCAAEGPTEVLQAAHVHLHCTSRKAEEVAVPAREWAWQVYHPPSPRPTGDRLSPLSDNENLEEF